MGELHVLIRGEFALVQRGLQIAHVGRLIGCAGGEALLPIAEPQHEGFVRASEGDGEFRGRFRLPKFEPSRRGRENGGQRETPPQSPRRACSRPSPARTVTTSTR